MPLATLAMFFKATICQNQRGRKIVQHFVINLNVFYFQDVLNANETQEFEREFFAFRSVIRVR